MPACDATCAAAVAFPKVDWKNELACLSDVSDPVEVIKIATKNGLSGICNVVAGMDPQKVAGLGEIIERMQSFNHRIAVAAAETPLRDLDIGYQCVICHPDIANAMISTSEGISHAVRKRIENEVTKDINEDTTVYVFVQPRMSSSNIPVSVYFTLQFVGEGATSGSRMIESYNFMKGNGTVTAKELEDHWKEHGIERPAIRPPTSKFELLFAPLPHNSKLAVTDFTHLGPVERDKGLLGSTVFGIVANKPDAIVYQCEKVLCLDVDVQMHRALDAIVKEYVLGLFDAPTMVTPRNPTRASFYSQYIRFREPHQAEKFNEIGVLILSAAAQMLECYAEFLEDGPKDDS